MSDRYRSRPGWPVDPLRMGGLRRAGRISVYLESYIHHD